MKRLIKARNGKCFAKLQHVSPHHITANACRTPIAKSRHRFAIDAALKIVTKTWRMETVERFSTSIAATRRACEQRRLKYNRTLPHHGERQTNQPHVW
jgi:hypothetical protein